MTAYLLDRAASSFGGWVDSTTERFASSSKKVGNKGERQYPKANEIVAYRRALVTGESYRTVAAGTVRRLRPRKAK